MLHPPPTPSQSVSRRSSFKLATPNMLPSTWSATGSSACTRWITKSHSSPVHVNETQAPLWSSKALLSADSYHLPLASERVTARQGYSGDEELLFHFVSLSLSHSTFPNRVFDVRFFLQAICLTGCIIAQYILMSTRC